MRKTLIALALSAAALPALAVDYQFDVLYFGGNTASLAGGSDDPLTNSVAVGDSFTYRLLAQGGGSWATVSDVSSFPFFSLMVSEVAERTADWTLELKNDGATVFSLSASALWHAYIHMGTNRIDLGSGLVFDEISLDYTLLSSGSATNTAVALLPYPGSAPEYYSTGVIYNAVPEPASYALMGLGLLGLGWRRQRAR